MKNAEEGMVGVTHTLKPGSARLSAVWVSTILAPSPAWALGGWDVCVHAEGAEPKAAPAQHTAQLSPTGSGNLVFEAPISQTFCS